MNALRAGRLKSVFILSQSQRGCEEEINQLCNSIGVGSTAYLTRVLLHFSNQTSDKPIHSAVLSELSSLLSSGAGRAAFCAAADQKRSTQVRLSAMKYQNLYFELRTT